MKNKNIKAISLLTSISIIRGITSFAAVQDNSTHETGETVHEDVKTEYVDIVEPNGEYLIADGKIKSTLMKLVKL